MKQRIPSDYINQTSRYNHNMAAGQFGTLHAGVVVPSKFRRLKIGDRVRGNIETLVQAEPFEGPVMQGFDIYTIATFTPDSVIHGWQDNGQNFSPENMLKFDYWLFSALCPISPSLDADANTFYAPLGWWDYAQAEPVEDFATSWPNSLVGVTQNENGSFLSAVGLGGLWDWLGVPAGATPEQRLDSRGDRTPYLGAPEYCWNVAPVVAYALSCIYYFRNLQEPNMYFTKGSHNMDDVTLGGMSDVLDTIVPNDMLSGIEYLHFFSRQGQTDNAQMDNYALAEGTLGPDDPEFGWQAQGHPATALNRLCVAGLDTYGGLFSAPYGPDLFNNIIKVGESPTAACPVITTEEGTVIAMPDLRAAEREQSILDRLYASGGRWDDVRKALFGKKGNTTSNKPLFLGAWKSFINPINQVATSAGQGSDGPVELGQMAARLDTWSDYNNQEYLDFFAEEAGTLMFLTVIMPQPAYGQGLNPDLFVHSWADEFNPEQNGAGFQTVPRHRYTMLPQDARWFNPFGLGSGDTNMEAVGEEVAWSWDRTDVPRLHGEFGPIGEYQYWTIHRDFTMFSFNDREFYGDSITSYINPMEVQYLFRKTDFDKGNFRLMTNLNISITNAVSDHYMPFLGH